MDLLALTLAGGASANTQGVQAKLRWQWLAEGVLEICPLQDYQQAVVISAGIHGNETAPIELLNQLVQDIFAGTIPLSVRLLVILGNPVAMRNNTRYQVSDLNRMFGGRHQQFPPSEETARVQQLEQIVSTFFAGENAMGFHYDLHTAIRGSYFPRFAILPYQLWPYSDQMLALLNAAELDAVVIHQAPGGTFSHFSSEFMQAASCTLELGKAQPFGCNDLVQFTSIFHALRAVVSSMPLAVRQKAALRVFRVVHSLIKRSEAFTLYLNDKTLNFTEFPRGMLLAEQSDEIYRVQHDKEWILFPNPHVALGLRAGMMLIDVPHSMLSGNFLMNNVPGERDV